MKSFITASLRARGVTLGSGAYVSPRAVVREPKRVTIGEGSTVGRWAELNPQGGAVHIGRNCSIHNLVVLYGAGGITIADDCRIANGAVLISFNHIFSAKDAAIRTQGITAKGITLEPDVWVGARAMILDGVTIGRGCVVGAGAVVTKSLPPYAVAVGNPARVVSTR